MLYQEQYKRISQHLTRDSRVTAHFPVTMLFPFDPWRIACSARSVNISTSGILLFIDASRGFADDIATLLTAEPELTLQLEHQIPHIFAPVLTARCVRQNQHASGLECAFTFLQLSEDIVALLEALSQDTHRDNFQ